MRKLLLSFLLIIISLSSEAQTVPSSCTQSQVILDSFYTDAQRLAIRRVFKFRAQEMDSTHIPQDRTDTALQALTLIYNATTLPARDTVTDMLHIHSLADNGVDSPYNFTMNKLQIWSGENQPWMVDFYNNVIPTSDPAINQLLSDYELQLDQYLDLTSGMDGLYFTSDSNYNLAQVAKVWEQVYFCIGGDLGVTDDAPDILLDSITPTYTQLSFKYGWGSCATGCDYNRYWTFQANFDCTVTYMGSSGDTLPYTVLVPFFNKQKIQVYPNPFTDKISIKNISGDSDYSIYSATGVLVQKGRVGRKETIAVDCAPGVYYLRLSDKNGVRVAKLLRE